MIDDYAARINGGPGRFMRLLGCRFIDRRRGKIESWRMRWGDISIRAPGLALGLHNFGIDSNGWSFHFAFPGLVSLFVKVPWLNPRDFDHSQGHESWGFSTGGDGVGWRSIHFNWGQKCKIFYYPWDWKNVRHDVLQQDGTWTPHRFEWDCGPEGSVDFRGRPVKWREPPKLGIEKYPYRYVLRSGEVQERIATVYVEEWEWRWRWFHWLPLPRKIRRSINVSFSDEVGERTGSWKGGCTGCGYDLLPDETPRECLYRMQRERRFD